MKNTYLKILKYTLLFMTIIVMYKIFIQNQLFDNDYSCGYYIAMIILKVSLFIFTLFLLKYEKIKPSNFHKNNYLLIIVVVIVLCRIYQNVLSQSVTLKMDIDYFKLTFYSLYNFSIGLFEEFYFRLFIFCLLCSIYKNNLFKICILTSSFFAIVHLSNLILDSYNFADVLFQVMFAFATGLFLQLIFVNFKNIYIPVLIHFYIDFNSNFSEKFFNITPKQINESGFDFTTFGILLIFISLSLIFAYFNLKKKEVNYFQTDENI